MLSEFWGQPVILASTRRTGAPVCSDQLALYQAMLSEFRKLSAELIGISVDSVWSHLAFAKDRNLHSRCSPISNRRARWPRTYQVYRAKEGTTERALFVIGPDGIIRWSYVSPVGVNPDANGILRALESLGKEEPS
jgi:peroxiredoxin